MSVGFEEIFYLPSHRLSHFHDRGMSTGKVDMILRFGFVPPRGFVGVNPLRISLFPVIVKAVTFYSFLHRFIEGTCTITPVPGARLGESCMDVF